MSVDDDKVIENNVSVDITDSSVTYESLIPDQGPDPLDTNPMFSDEVEDRVWSKQNIGQKRYVPFLPHRLSCPGAFQRKELAVLFTGCFMMFVSVALIVTGVLRIHECTTAPLVSTYSVAIYI